jgi:hypothetical protein
VEDFDDEGGRGREFDAWRIAVRCPQQLRRERSRRLPLFLRAQRPRCEAAQALHQREPEHDRDRPELSDRERSDVLVRVGEPAQRFFVEAAGGMGDELARQHVTRGYPPPASRQRRSSVRMRREDCADLQKLSRTTW